LVRTTIVPGEAPLLKATTSRAEADVVIAERERNDAATAAKAAAIRRCSVLVTQRPTNVAASLTHH
jgi:hypothetical protein